MQTCQCCAQGKDALRPRSREASCGVAPGRVLRFGAVQYHGALLLKLLRAALPAATEEEPIERDVACLVKLRATDVRKIAPLSVQESRRFLAVARTHRLSALWAVAPRSSPTMKKAR
ncbi:MAG: hypothetical protein ACRDSG_11530 [Pseudonocardiaceae bacterium]